MRRASTTITVRDGAGTAVALTLEARWLLLHHAHGPGEPRAGAHLVASSELNRTPKRTQVMASWRLSPAAGPVAHGGRVVGDGPVFA